jgi:two-component system chemotaxis response regulator CheB
VSALRVLVVDDSALVREVLGGVLAGGRFQVAVAADPLIARQKIARARPDVIVLDLEMPRMDGMTFLRELMSRDPIPVVICSGHTDQPEVALRALDAGAVDIVSRPRLGVSQFLQDSAVVLVDTVRSAAQARVNRRLVAPPRLTADVVLPRVAPRRAADAERIVAIGASTGGTDALRALLVPLPEDVCGLVVVQHMPSPFTAAFAKRLDQECRIEVREARHGDRVQLGCALIAPGDRHVVVVRDRGGYRVELSDGPLVSRHRPSVDVLFRSVAIAAGSNALGLVLTGMGDDGAAGTVELKQAGAATVAQNEATSVVFGMPKEAIRRGAVDRVLPLSSMAAHVVAWSSARDAASR